MCDVTPPADCQLALDPRAAGQARSFLRQVTCEEHVARVVDDAELLVSELVTNGVRYGAPPIVLRVECLGELGLRVAVSDGAAALPAVADPAELADRGRGLRLVDYISSSWGVEPSEAGKTTWFLIRDEAETGGAR